MDNKIPNQEQENEKKGLKKNAINQKQNESDGADINHQVKDKREKHQPRDNA